MATTLGGAPVGFGGIGGAPAPTLNPGAQGTPMAPDTGQVADTSWPQYSPNGNGNGQQPVDQSIQTTQPYDFKDNLQLGGPMGGGQPAPAPAPQIQPQQQPAVAQTPQPQPVMQQPLQQPVQSPVQQPVPQQVYQQPPANVPTMPMVSPTNLRDTLVQQGYPVSSYLNDEQLLGDIGNASNEATELRRLADIGRQAISQEPVGPAPVAAPATPTTQEEPWNEEWGSLLEIDPANGLYKPKQGNEIVAAQIAQVANRRQAVQRERAEAIVSDPFAYINDNGLSEELDAREERILRIIDNREAERNSVNSAREFYSANQHLLQQIDPNTGQAVISPYNHQPMPTQLGQAVEQRKQEFAAEFQVNYGTQPDEWLLKQAVQPMIEAAASQQPQAPQPQEWGQQPVQQFAPAPQPQVFPQPAVAPQPTLVQQPGVINQAVNNPAFFTPQTNGTIASAANNAAIPQDHGQNFGAALRQSAVARGLVHPDAY